MSLDTKVKPQDIESFMCSENGVNVLGFDREAFLASLDMGRPRRAQQRRAADAVIRAIKRKMAKSSYRDLLETYGYGSLIVGLPLWFATGPLNPIRAENAVDDFTTRVKLGLAGQKRQLRRRDCPFRRVVVVWDVSLESLREWGTKAKLDIYKDPTAYRKMGPFTVSGGTLFLPLLDMSDAPSDITGHNPPTPSYSLDVQADRKNVAEVALPPDADVGQLIECLNDVGRPTHGRCSWMSVRFWGMLVRVHAFVRAHGVAGLRHWVVTRLSPAHRVARFVLRLRVLGLYRRSVKGSAGLD